MNTREQRNLKSFTSFLRFFRPISAGVVLLSLW